MEDPARTAPGMAWKNSASATAASATLETSQYTAIPNFKRDCEIYLSVHMKKTPKFGKQLASQSLPHAMIPTRQSYTIL